MDFEVFIEAIFALLRSSESTAFVVGCLVVCLLSLVVKRLFVSKLKIVLLNKLDVGAVLPFVLGAASAVVSFFVVDGKFAGSDTVYKLLVDALSIGATATVLLRLCEKLFTQGLDKLLRDDVFGTVYHEIMLLSSAKEKLLNREIKLSEFIANMTDFKSKALEIYSDSETDGEQKLTGLKSAIQGLVDDDSLDAIVNSLHSILISLDKSK